MIPDSDISNTRPILRKSIACQGRKLIVNYAGKDRAGDRRASGHTGHVVLGYHAEYLAGPRLHSSSLNSGVIGLDSL